MNVDKKKLAIAAQDMADHSFKTVLFWRDMVGGCSIYSASRVAEIINSAQLEVSIDASRARRLMGISDADQLYA